MRPLRTPSRPAYATALLSAYLIGTACSDGPNQGSSSPNTSLPETGADDDSRAPLRLSYVCGNRFVLVSSSPVPVTVTWRVSETSEEGSATVRAASPEQHPSSSEQLIETRTRGTLELSQEGRRIKARANGGIPCTPSVPAPSFAGASLADLGEWGPVLPWPIVAVHGNLLPNGKVLLWGSAPSGLPHVWDPATDVFTPYPSPALLFCAGHSFTTNGELLVIGGHIRGDHGLPNVTLFRQNSGWSSLPPMPRGRWYPTVTTMAGGEVVAVAGMDQQAKHVGVPEVWTSGSGLRRLTGASLVLPYYPVNFLAPNGKLFVAGEQQQSRYLDITGTGAWTNVALRRFGTRDQGAAVMYTEGRVLYAGGGRTTNTAETINLKPAAPKWEWTGPMAYARRHHNLTMLPTGEVLVTGGTAGTEFNDLTKMVRAAESWNPATGLWTTLASSDVDRGYHSIALLLPDGRVLQAGAGAGGDLTINQFNAQLFSPPYLFRGPRPVISSVPTGLRYARAFQISTPEAASIAAVTLVRLGSVTHGLDMNQRFRKVGFTVNATGLSVAITNRKHTPPGHYMLFIVDGNGVPSVGKIIQIK